MTEREGVTKYTLAFEAAPAPPVSAVAPLLAWRRILHRLGLIGGGDPARYLGLGFGNLSRRGTGGAFIVSGTQTGHLEALTAEHFCRITAWDIEANHLQARGPVEPSSEALTHAAAYQSAPDVQFVFHGHHPAIWNAARTLDLPVTPPDAAYGTPAMAHAIAACLEPPGRDGRVVVMSGHQDGVLSTGATPEAAGAALVSALARTLTLS